MSLFVHLAWLEVEATSELLLKLKNRRRGGNSPTNLLCWRILVDWSFVQAAENSCSEAKQEVMWRDARSPWIDECAREWSGSDRLLLIGAKTQEMKNTHPISILREEVEEYRHLGVHLGSVDPVDKECYRESFLPDAIAPYKNPHLCWDRGLLWQRSLTFLMY